LGLLEGFVIYTVTLNPTLDRTLTVAEIVFNDVLRASQVRLDWGGKGLNVSRALKALGGESVVMGFCGGATGKQLEDGLHALDIRTHFTHIENETRSTVFIAEVGSERHIKVNEIGPLVSPVEQAALLRLVTETAQPGDYWTLNGSLPPGAAADIYARLTAIVQERGGRACLDSSGEALRLGCQAKPYLVKPNRVEAEALCGFTIQSREDALRAAQVFLELGVGLVALSLGGDGLLLAAPSVAAWAKPPQVTIQGPTGAGDALLAGLLWAFQSGASFEDAARWGAACGTAAALLPGTAVADRAGVESVFSVTQIYN
jgi:1-phosphofructokinase family hexose kinase